MYTLGIDLGSSSVKAAVLETETGRCVGSASFPENEMEISSPKPGWAEQHPETWWENTLKAIRKSLSAGNIRSKEIAAVGIAYQMHGLVAVDKNLKSVRPSIIWCDSRAVETGINLFRQAGEEKCLSNLLNSPGNFTFSKLVWVKNHEPEFFEKIHKIMLPGDYIAMKLTGEISTTITGLSEGILWNFRKHALADFLLEAGGVDQSKIAQIVPVFGNQGELSGKIADELGLKAGIPVSYRAGDQPNNAFSLNVLNPGEIAATAGTSGVVYGVTDKVNYDPQQRVNTFAHINHNSGKPRFGILLCINGTGISNSWIKKMTGISSYEEMDAIAGTTEPGADGLLFIPFGNGAERMLGNRNPGAGFFNIDLKNHSRKHLFRAVQEGVACAFRYGMEIMQQTGLDLNLIRAGKANMFLSPLFCQTLSNLSGAEIQLFDTDGALGAARGAALGAGLYETPGHCFSNLSMLKVYRPQSNLKVSYDELFRKWTNHLNMLKSN
ncbi:MAG TPA: FGGY family carbohydrate kinase [Bacteroidales bacterium]|nr:FGGY family carbohydrate kinase [Bacteroidales bacterium]